MTVVLSHPEEEKLLMFSLGRLSVAERAEIERHLEKCNTCCAVLGNRMESRDTLLELARQAAATPIGNLSIDAIASIPPELMDHPRYRIIAPLGEGGMGVVYKAEHKLMGRVVALKLINKRLTANDQAVERFRREVRAAAKLGHTNIVTAYEAEEVNGLLFLVMEYVEGISLDRFVARQKNPVPVAMACHFVRQAALGLQHAHRQGMVHRDIKPQNLMLTRKGQIKILDFGLARLGAEPEPDGLSQPNLVVGTPDYLAPEQARNSHDVDIRADIYALGCTLYFLLARRVPFPGGTAYEKMFAHTEATPDALSQFRSDLPPEVCAIVDRAMAKEKEGRFQTPVDLANALTPFAKLAIGGSTGTELTPAQPILDPIFLDDEPIHMMADTQVMADAPTHRTRTRHRPISAASRPRWLLPAIAACVVVFVGIVIYFATRDRNDGNSDGSKEPEQAKNDTKTPNKKSGKPDPITLAPKKDGIGAIDSKNAKYKVMIVVPKEGLWYRDLEPLRQKLMSKGVSVSLGSSDYGQVRFQPNSEIPAQEVRVDGFSLQTQVDHHDCDAILITGANVNEFNPDWSNMNFPKGKMHAGRNLAGILKAMHLEGKIVGSICSGQAVLHWSGVINGRKVATLDHDPMQYNLTVRFPNAKWEGTQRVVRDGNLITASGPGQGMRFADDVYRALTERRP